MILIFSGECHEKEAQMKRTESTGARAAQSPGFVGIVFLVKCFRNLLKLVKSQ